MTWLFVIICFVLAVYGINAGMDRRREERIQRATINSLLASIGGSNNRDELIKEYFSNMENVLNVNDFEAVFKNVCIAVGVVPEYDKGGLINDKTMLLIADEFSKYTVQLHATFKDR
jgi:hypothetical protein